MKRALALLFVFLLLILSCPGAGRAGRDKAAVFALEVILPSDHIGNEGYHVPARPGAVISLKARLTNLADEPIEIYTVPLNAYSGAEGIFYQSPNEVDTQTYALVKEMYGLAQYVDVADTFMLMPEQSMAVNIYVRVPEIKAGCLLGGVRFVAYPGGQRPDNGQQNSRAAGSEYQTIDAAIRIDLPAEARTSVVAGLPKLIGPTVGIPVVNGAAAVEENVSAVYEIRDEHDAVIVKGSVALPQMAPMTEFYMPHSRETWEDGAYTLYMKTNADGQTTDFALPFTVSGENVSPAEETEPAEITGGPEESPETAPVETAGQQAAETRKTEPAGEKALAALAAPDAIITAQKAVIPFVVFGIPAAFVFIIARMCKKQQSRGRHARPRHLAADRRSLN